MANLPITRLTSLQITTPGSTTEGQGTLGVAQMTAAQMNDMVNNPAYPLPDGTALPVLNGTIIYNLTANGLYNYTGGAWQAIGGGAGGGNVIAPNNTKINAISSWVENNSTTLQNTTVTANAGVLVAPTSVSSPSVLVTNNGGFNTTITSGANANSTLVLPVAAGANGQVLSTNGPGGVLSWVNNEGGGGVTFAAVNGQAVLAMQIATFSQAGDGTIITNATVANANPIIADGQVQAALLLRHKKPKVGENDLPEGLVGFSNLEILDFNDPEGLTNAGLITLNELQFITIQVNDDDTSQQNILFTDDQTSIVPTTFDAIVEIKSDAGGFLLPRLTTEVLSAMINPVAGLTAYNSTTNEMVLYNGSSFVPSSGTAGVQSVTAGTGIGVSGTTEVTVTNTGVTGIVAGTNITLSGDVGTGDVTINASGGGGGGNVSGPNLSTSDAVAIFNGTSGTLLENSNLLYNSSNELSGLNSIALSSGSAVQGFTANNNGTATVNWTLPAADGLDGQVLSTNGAAQLEWTSTGNVIGPADGADNYSVTLFKAGTLLQSSSLTFNNSTLNGLNTLMLGITTGNSSQGFTANLTGTKDITWTLPAADGLDGQVLGTNGAAQLEWTTGGGGTGNVTGPSSSINSTVPIFSGATGEIITNSTLYYTNTTNTLGSTGIVGSIIGISNLLIGNYNSQYVPLIISATMTPGVYLGSTTIYNNNFLPADMDGGNLGGSSGLFQYNFNFGPSNGIDDIAPVNITGQSFIKLAGCYTPVNSGESSTIWQQGFATNLNGTDVIWTLPASDGSPSQILTTDGNANLSWTSVTQQPLTGNELTLSQTLAGTTYTGILNLALSPWPTSGTFGAFAMSLPLYINAEGPWSTSSQYGYLDEDGSGNTGSVTNAPVCLFITNRGVATEWDATSSITIKTVLDRTDQVTKEATDLLSKIPLVKYQYKDRLKHGNGNYYGVIAEELREIMPELVHDDSAFVPNIMAKGFVDGYTPTLTDTARAIVVKFDQPQDLDILIDKKVQMYVNKGSITGTILTNSNEYINVALDKEIAIADLPKEIFVYGTQENCPSVAKERLAELSLIVIQDLMKDRDNLMNRIAILEKRIN